MNSAYKAQPEVIANLTPLFQVKQTTEERGVPLGPLGCFKSLWCQEEQEEEDIDSLFSL